MLLFIFKKLLTAHKEQLIAEQGLYKYCEADECKLRADIRKSEKQKNDTEELNSRMQSKFEEKHIILDKSTII